MSLSTDMKPIGTSLSTDIKSIGTSLSTDMKPIGTSLLDENFDTTDVQTLGSMCTRVYKEFFNLNCNVVFDGIGKIKLEDILEHPARYALASRSLPNWDDPTEY